MGHDLPTWHVALAVPRLDAWALTDPRIRQGLESALDGRVGGGGPALCGLLDFIWIDTEPNPLGLEAVQAHVMATKGSETAPLVRVAWNDPVLVKPVLAVGAARVVVPLIRTADDARRAVAACLY